MPPAIPLVQQIEELRFAIARQRSLMAGAKIRELRKPTVAEHGLACLEMAARSLETLAINAEAFTAVNGTVTRVHTLAMHKAAVTAGDETARQIERVAKAGGAKVLTYPVPELKQQPGQTMAIGALRELIQEYGAEAAILGLRSVTETSNAVRGGLTGPIVKTVGRLAAVWLVQGRDPQAFITAIDGIVLIREADKAARDDRAPGEALANAIVRRISLKLGLTEPDLIKVPS